MLRRSDAGVRRADSIQAHLVPQLESPLIRSIRELVDAIVIEAKERTHPENYAGSSRADALLVTAALRRVRSSRRVTFAGTQALTNRQR